MKHIITLLFLIVSHFVHAQLDNIHYLQPITSPNADDGIQDEYVYLSTPSKETIIVNITFNNDSIPILLESTVTGTNPVINTNGKINLSNANPVRIRFLRSSNSSNSFLDPGTESSPITPSMDYAGRVIKADEKIGLIFKSTEKFYVNYRARSTNQSASMLSKGRGGLGKRFYWLGLPSTDNSNSTQSDVNASLTVTAIEDSTQVVLKRKDPNLRLIRTSNLTQWDPGESDTINLNKGQSYIYVSRMNTIPLKTAFLGTELTSTKNVIVTTSNLLQLGHTGTSRDISTEQIIPTDLTGKNYIAVQGFGNLMERVYVLATEDDTEIQINDGEKIPLSKGQTHFILGEVYNAKTGWLKITSNNNIYVSQKLFGTTAANSSDFKILPPISCNGEIVIDNIPQALTIGTSNYTQNSRVFVLYRTFANEINVTASSGTVQLLKTVNDVMPGWSLNTYSIPNSNIKIVSSGSIQGHLLSASGQSGFGNYFSGFSIPPILPTVLKNMRFDNACTGDTGETILTTSIGNYQGEYQWFKNDNKIEGATSTTYPIPKDDIEPAIYRMEVKLNDGCLYLSEEINTVKCPCVKQPNTNPGTLYPGIVGVTTSNIDDQNWPKNFNNSFLALESNNKGLVITRNADPENTITNPVKGMIVYDTDDNCYKLFNGSIWSCLKQKCYDYDN